MHHSSSEVGKFATVFENYDNVETPIECELRGTPPKFLEGTMLRNGPGMFQIGNDMYKHWFDGLAYPQRYHFQDGKLFYSAKFIETNDYMNNINNRTIVTSSFGTYKFPDPCKRIYGRFETKFDKGDADSPAENPSVSFRQHGDGIYACTESPILYRIDPDSLSILGRLDMSQYVCVYTYTAHSNSDYEGNVYNIGTKFLSTHPEYIFTKTMNPANNPNAKNRHTCEDTRIVGTVKSTAADSPCYYHSFGMTQNHFVLLEGPVRISLKDIATR
ncbi:hypothetical protein WR25_17258 [Diploscapter pachys]|uniref:Uncharacterized protein n=1 Tax=Diploscapter pachys TaxID=2018661 RepID=A0A2A2L0A3_9BILA|nr:hypothetical protein WR25_17258 [Diploscapter pachys]